jgi:hypothetical protein
MKKVLFTMFGIEITLTSAAFLVMAFFAVLPLSSLAADDYTAPRTEWGQPDLQGVWNFSSNTPIQRPAIFGEREFLTADEIEEMQRRLADQDANSDAAGSTAGVDEGYNDFWLEKSGIGGDVRTSLIVYPANGQLPSLAEGAITEQGSFVFTGTTGDSRPVRREAGGIGADGPEDRGLSERCIIGFNAGPPLRPAAYNNNVQIIQNKDTVVVLTEMIHEARIVPLYGSAQDLQLLNDDIRLWVGDSRGYWDGDTLVVETRNFNGLSASFNNVGASYDKVLTERFTRRGPSTVDYEYTLDDPSTYTDKFTGIISMTKLAGQLYEYACHEGNYGMVNTLRGARVQENFLANER